MTNLTKKLVTATATVAILANAVTPLAFASTTITVTGNGADSQSSAAVNNVSTTSVSQNNEANFTNNVSGNANTGSNDANKNTGGDVNVKTGDASVNNTVSNSANQNNANVGCDCESGDTLVKVAGNGADSKNAANLSNVNTTVVGQNNNANFNNNVSGNAKTGNNDADKNTGGDVTVETGDASVSNHVSNWANANSARVGSGNGNGGSTSLLIKGNGADSENGISVADVNSVVLSQDNDADFNNKVGGNANTGDNDADKNTGGSVAVETGDASVDNSVDNQANFNWADLNCDCTVGDLTATVEGNGYDSENAIEGQFASTQAVGQENKANFDNFLDCIFAGTGNNDADKNTGDSYSDPSVQTGDAAVESSVSNTANLNDLGGSQPEWPSWDMGGTHVSVNIDINALLAALGL